MPIGAAVSAAAATAQQQFFNDVGGGSSGQSPANATNILPPLKAPAFSLNGRRAIGRVAQVTDGDTLKIVFGFDDGSKFYTFNCRMVGIDSPELKSDNPSIAREALRTMDRMYELVSVDDRLVDVECHEFDKYGRVLVVLRQLGTTGKSINDMLLDEGFAQPYRAKPLLNQVLGDMSLLE